MSKLITNNGSGSFRINKSFTTSTYASWSVTTKIITSITISECTLINHTDISSNSVKSFKVKLNNNGTLTMYLSSNGTDYNITTDTGITSVNILKNYSSYYIKLEFTGTEYILSVSSDNTIYTTYCNITSSLKCNYSSSMYVVFIETDNLTYFTGNLDIEETKLTGDNASIFNGSSTTSNGYFNNGVTVTAGIASNFSASNYIQCSGFEFKDYVKFITRITTGSDVTNEQYILVNEARDCIYINNGKIGLKINNQTREENISANKTYWVGYLYNSIENKHYLYLLEDDGYYSGISYLPDFFFIKNHYCLKPWNSPSYITYANNVFKSSLYLGSNKSVKYFKGTIDLNNTLFGNNIVTHSISKLGFDPNTGVHNLDQSMTVQNVSLTPLSLYTVNGTMDGHAIDLSGEIVSFTAVNSSNLTIYPQAVPTVNNQVYVPAGSSVTTVIPEGLTYLHKTDTYTINSDTSRNIALDSKPYVMLTINSGSDGTLVIPVNGKSESRVKYFTWIIDWGDGSPIIPYSGSSGGIGSDPLKYIRKPVSNPNTDYNVKIYSSIQTYNNWFSAFGRGDQTSADTQLKAISGTVALNACVDLDKPFALAHEFTRCNALTSIDLSAITTIDCHRVMESMFQSCAALTSVDLSSLTTISSAAEYAMWNAFNNCTALTSIDLSSLTTISGAGGMYTAFYNCAVLASVNFNALSTITGVNAMYRAFGYCRSLQTLSFPALNSNSFGTYTTQFKNMLEGVTGCTVHFPSNLQAVIGSLSDVVGGFGGTNTTVLFDLPATN